MRPIDLKARRKARRGWIVGAVLPCLAVLTILLWRLPHYQHQLEDKISQPLGPSLPTIPGPTQAPSLITSSLPQTATPEALLCGRSGQMIILAVGIDSSSSYAMGLADVIRVVRVDFSTPQISMLAVPRDLWVMIPELGGEIDPSLYFGHPQLDDGTAMGETGTFGRINSAYYYGNVLHLPGDGIGLLAQTLYENFGLRIDHYTVVNMVAFVEAVDSIGGIDISLVNPADGTEIRQHMNGDTALEYARARRQDSDFHRMERQNEVLYALRQRILDPAILPHVGTLVNSTLDNVTTDLSQADLASLVCLGTLVNQEDIHQHAIDPTMMTATTTTKSSYILLPDADQVRQLMQDFVDGTLDAQAALVEP